MRCAIESLDHRRVEKRVALGDDASGTAAASIPRFAVDEGDASFAKVAWRNEERLVVRLLGVGGQIVEDIVDGGGDGVIAREKTEVRVIPRSGRIVIPRA